jgi:RNA polymerase sigma-70 factor (ECF subfamily)
MSLPESFVSLFLPVVEPAARAQLTAAAPALETLLRSRWHAARAAWPDVMLPPELFWAHVGARVPATSDGVAAIATLQLEHLYLACACLTGNAVALAHVDACFFPVVDALLARMRLDPADADEVKQHMRRRLFTREGGREPKVAAYSGRGDLGAWLRATAYRTALKLIAARHGATTGGESRLIRLSGDSQPELRYLKSYYRPLFRQAFTDAVTALPPADKELLREYYADKLSLIEIAARRDAHRVTVARWLDEIRHRLLERTRTALMQRVRVPRHECDSIIRIVQSRLDLTFRDLFRVA